MTIDKVGGTVETKHVEIYGKSTETKPTQNIHENDLYVEVDTGDVYYFDIATHTWKALGE